MSSEDPDPRAELAELGAALQAHLARAEHAGVRRFAPAGTPETAPIPAGKPPSPPPIAAAAGAPLRQAELVPAAPPAPTPAVADPRVEEQRRRASACATLDELRGRVADCRACGLAATRTQTVFSDGPPQARVLFVGEAPGEQEDLRGVPFVGPAGELLTDIIQKGMGLPRTQVHIANILKCRPPGNRDPSPEEKALCTPFLDRQLELLDPELVIALGPHAAQHLLRSELTIGRLRGRVHAYGKRKLIATYHPAYLLRTPSAKKDCWQDIQLAMRELGLPTPPRPTTPGDPAR